MYEVIRAFRDSKHNDHLYEVGDSYPASGSKPTKARIEELLKGTNKYGRVYLREVEDPKNPDHNEGKTPDPNESENATKGDEGNGKA